MFIVVVKGVRVVKVVKVKCIVVLGVKELCSKGVKTNVFLLGVKVVRVVKVVKVKCLVVFRS